MGTAGAAGAAAEDRVGAGARGIVAWGDRWIFVLTAGLFVATALVGFVPDSVDLLGEVRRGDSPPLPLVLHVHAALMGTWLLLLLAQASLVAVGRRDLHQRLGLIAFALVPVMVVAGLILAPTVTHRTLDAIRSAPAPVAAKLKGLFAFQTNIALMQIHEGMVFPLLVGLALARRRADPDLHKRLMPLATVVPLHAAIGRMHWLPATLPTSPLSFNLYMLALIAPMLGWDLFRRRRVPAAYWIWLGVNLPFVVAQEMLWNSPWWMQSMGRVLGA